jgi:hypothetical protein
MLTVADRTCLEDCCTEPPGVVRREFRRPVVCSRPWAGMHESFAVADRRVRVLVYGVRPSVAFGAERDRLVRVQTITKTVTAPAPELQRLGPDSRLVAGGPVMMFV